MTTRAYLLIPFLIVVLLALVSGCTIAPRAPGSEQANRAKSAEYDRIEQMRVHAEKCARQYSAFDLTKGCRDDGL